MKRLFRTLLALAVGLTAAPVLAQTTGTTTTLAAAVTAAGQAGDTSSAQQINVASATGIVVGDLVAVLRGGRVAEFMRVQVINGTYLTVARGIDSRVVAHLNGATIYVDPEANYYRGADPTGACTRASEVYLPHINRTTGVVSECSTAGVWYRFHERILVSCATGILATGSVDQTCWSARDNYVITAISYVSQVVETAGTLTVIPRRQQGTEAPASGDSLATAISGVSTVAQTVTAFTLTTTGADLLLDAGDRLGIDFTDDVAGELLGVVITFTLAPY